MNFILNTFKSNYEPLTETEKDDAYKVINVDINLNPFEAIDAILEELKDTTIDYNKDKIIEVYNDVLAEEKEKAKQVSPTKRTLYWSAVFPYDEREKILNHENVKKILEDNSEWKVICDHLTLLFLKGETRLEETDFHEYEGKLIELEFTSLAWDDKITAIKVKLDTPCENTNPHVTLALSKGTSPVYSNTMLENPNDEIFFDEPLIVKARVARILK
jgi:hypothetical protein